MNPPQSSIFSREAVARFEGGLLVAIRRRRQHIHAVEIAGGQVDGLAFRHHGIELAGTRRRPT